MIKVAKQSIDSKKMRWFYDDLWEAVGMLENEKMIEGFFGDLLTRTEKTMIVKRFQVALMLIEGHNYQTIIDHVGVANSTVARISDWLKDESSQLGSIAKLMIKIDREREAESRRGKKYAVGDLLTPLVDDGLKAVAQKAKKRNLTRISRLNLPK
ncbi:Trp family transcriptional regulator [Patescibacteria group bacterium]